MQLFSRSCCYQGISSGYTVINPVSHPATWRTRIQGESQAFRELQLETWIRMHVRFVRVVFKITNYIYYHPLMIQNIKEEN